MQGRIAAQRVLWPNGPQEAAVSSVGFWVPAIGLSEQRLDALAQALLIGGAEAAEGFAHQGLLEGGEHGLDGRGLEQPRTLPVLDDDLAELPAPAYLAGDRHEDQIAPGAVVGEARDDDSRALLGGGLVREWEGDQHDIPELIGHACPPERG